MSIKNLQLAEKKEAEKREIEEAVVLERRREREPFQVQRISPCRILCLFITVKCKAFARRSVIKLITTQ